MIMIRLIVALSLLCNAFLAMGQTPDMEYVSIDGLKKSLGANMNFRLPKGWTEYTLGTAFSIMVPSTVELRKASDLYSHNLNRMGYTNGNIVFQQKGLANLQRSSYNKYCRIIIHYELGSRGDYLKRTDTEMLDDEWIKNIDSMVSWNIGPHSRLIGKYSYKWESINGAKCLRIDYRRTGDNFNYSKPVACRIAIFQNDNEIAIIILSYREKEVDLWKSDFDKVYKSFRWV